jgi:hypothetical protein
MFNGQDYNGFSLCSQIVLITNPTYHCLNHEAPYSGAPGEFKTCSRFENGGIGDRTNGDALWRIEVTFALHAGGGINHVWGSFGDRIGRALGHARATSNALVSNLHCHRFLLLDKSLQLFCA